MKYIYRDIYNDNLDHWIGYNSEPCQHYLSDGLYATDERSLFLRSLATPLITNLLQ